jgi:hypothetical protein
LALAVPLSRFTPRVGGGSAFYVRQISSRIMRAIFLCALAAMVSLSSEASDAIDTLVATLTRQASWSYPFPNGFWDVIHLPASASSAQLLAKLPKDGSFSLHTTNYSVLETRHVRIPQGSGTSNYTAILVKIPSGQKIVLAQFTGNSTNIDWEVRVYDVK